MSEATVLEPRLVKLPPTVALPKAIQGVGFAMSRRWTIRQAARRYGDVFTLNIPVFGNTVVVADPALVKQVFMASTDDLLNIKPNLSRVLGPGSIFALDRAPHRNRRKLLTPPFHGKSIKNYEQIIEEETLREAANWPVGHELRTLEPMMRITLNVILRAVFGAEGVELEYLRQLIPGWVKLGSRLATLPQPSRTYGRYSPWGRLAESHRKFDDDRRHTDRKGRGRPAFRRAHRHSRADAAQPVRRRFPDVASGDLRRVADFGRRRSRNDGVDAGVGVRATAQASRHRRSAGRRSRRRRQRATPGDDPGGPAGADRHRLRGPPSQRRCSNSANGASRGLLHRRQHFPAARELLCGPGSVRPVPIRRQSAADVRVGAVRRRDAAVHRRRVRQHRDGRGATNSMRPYFTIDSTTDSGEKVHSRGVAYTPKRGGRVVVRRR